MSPRVLLVEPNRAIADDLLHAARAVTNVDYQVSFETARLRLTGTDFDFVVTNLRLGEFNGLHLVHLAADLDDPPRCIVYTDTADLVLGREVQRAGAFYETASCLSVTLSAYMRGNLPASDRRDPTRIDRRGEFRGGRRCWDEYVVRESHA
jgi:DNA-binding NtrC family response regulator